MKEIRNEILGYTKGRPIVADILLQSSESPTMVFVHGFKGFKDWGAWNSMAGYFVKRGYNFIKFNLSHNGGTKDQVEDFPDLEAFGRNTFSLELEDIRTVIDQITGDRDRFKSIDPSKIALMGHSRGGAMSIVSAIEDDRVSALVTLNAVTDIISWMKQYDQAEWRADGVLWAYNSRTEQNMPMYLDLLHDFQDDITRFDILHRSESLDVPTLLVHCTDDPVVSYGQAQALHKCSKWSYLYLMNKGGHTLGAKHPMRDESFPVPLHNACDRIHLFFKELGWIEE